MNLTSTARYAIRILSFMAIQDSKLVSAKFLIEKLNISDKYLRGLMTKLAKRGLIRSIQGRDGGYEISRPLDEIHLIEIIKAVEDVEKYTGCVLGFEECSSENPCALHDQWNNIKQDTYTFLNTITLNEIVKDKQFLKF
ncbi:MAG: Rrf2 family transcriptional regulator [Prolixibacteraceae bacterium]